MGLFKRLLGRMGYVKLAEYGLELTEDGVVPAADDDFEAEGPYAVGSIVNGDPVPDSPVLCALEGCMTERGDLGIADTQKVIVDDDLAVEVELEMLGDEVEDETIKFVEDVETVKFIEADTIPAKKI